MGVLKLYNASAGSGKTYTLVKEFLGIILTRDGMDKYGSILAITFTNKAAAEMKSRILGTLKEFCSWETPQELRSGKNYGMFACLTREMSIDDGELKRRAKTVLTRILHDYSALSVGTIDAFTARLVKAFSRDMDLPVGFNLSVEPDQYLSESVEMLLLHAGEASSKALTHALLDFIYENIDDGKTWDLTFMLGDAAKILLKDQSIAPIDALSSLSLEDFNRVRKELSSRRRQIEENIRVLCVAGHEDLMRVAIDPENVFQSKGGIAAFLRKGAQGSCELNPQSSHITKFFEGNYYSAKGKKEGIDLSGVVPQIEECFTRVCDLLREHTRCRMVLSGVKSVSVLHQIERELRQVKAENNVMFLYEFNRIIERQVREQPVPFIYEKIGERYKHYFIDEFQDTSLMQWENLRPLVMNQLASDGSALLVGDGKQSIYRWRGGDVEQFLALSNSGIPSECGTKEVHNLDTNFRSSPSIVDFTNEFFCRAAEAFTVEAYKGMYHSGNRQKSYSTDPGFVSIRRVEGRLKAERDQQYKDAVLEEIGRVHGQDGRPYGDICILTRRNSDGAALASFLCENDIPVISSDSLLLKNSPEVLFLVSFLTLVANRRDREARMNVINYLERFCGLLSGCEDISAQKYALLRMRSVEFFEYLRRKGFAFSEREFHCLPLYQGVEYLIRVFGLQQQADSFVLFFLALVEDYSKGKTAGVSDFLEYWRQKNEKDSAPSVIIPQGIDAVRIMSVHKSKGLEFPVVILPYADWETKLDSLWLDLDKEANGGLPSAYVKISDKLSKAGYGELYDTESAKSQLDDLNLLYVALTRAESQLHIITAARAAGNSNNKFTNVRSYIDLMLQDRDEQAYVTPYCYTSGERTGGSVHRQMTQSYLLEDIICESFRDKLRISFEAPRYWSGEDQTYAERGNKIHEILSMVRTTQDVPRALRRALNKNLVRSEEQQEIGRYLAGTVSHPQIKHLFDDAQDIRVYNERDFLCRTPEGKMNVVRPDRVVLRGEEAAVIDYKTGRRQAAHAAQVNQYAALLGSLGYRVKEKYLVYLAEEVVVEKINTL